jgi:hypothetical protein
MFSRTLRTVLSVLVARVRSVAGPGTSCVRSGTAGAGFLAPWGARFGLDGPMPRTILNEVCQAAIGYAAWAAGGLCS